MSTSFTLRNFYLIIFLLSAISIAGALYIEYALEKKPCILCLYQRLPYILALVVSFVGLKNLKNIFWLNILFLIFLSSTILSGYHFGIENNFFNEFSGCKNDNFEILDKKDLLKSLMNKRPSCKNIDFAIFGLSLATINLIVSFIVSYTVLKILINEKNK